MARVAVEASRSHTLHVLAPVEDGPARRELLEAEARWAYSQHFQTERRGEEILEGMLARTSSPRARRILHAQLADELEHTRLYRRAADRTGDVAVATGFADAYVRLVTAQESLAEQLFVFQLLTESVAQANVAWRLAAIDDPALNDVDRTVLADELRHVRMGGSLLRLEPQLPAPRQKQLLRTMLELTKAAAAASVAYGLACVGQSLAARQTVTPSSLDRLVARTLLANQREVLCTISSSD